MKTSQESEKIHVWIASFESSSYLIRQGICAECRIYKTCSRERKLIALQSYTLMEKTFKVHVAVVTGPIQRLEKEEERVWVIGKQNESKSCTLVPGLPLSHLGSLWSAHWKAGLYWVWGGLERKGKSLGNAVEKQMGCGRMREEERVIEGCKLRWTGIAISAATEGRKWAEDMGEK